MARISRAAYEIPAFRTLVSTEEYQIPPTNMVEDTRYFPNHHKMILGEVQNLQSATLAMKDSMDEMSSGAKKINETGASLATISRQVQEAITKIGGQIDLFKVWQAF